MNSDIVCTGPPFQKRITMRMHLIAPLNFLTHSYGKDEKKKNIFLDDVGPLCVYIKECTYFAKYKRNSKKKNYNRSFIVDNQLSFFAYRRVRSSINN